MKIDILRLSESGMSIRKSVHDSSCLYADKDSIRWTLPAPAVRLISLKPS